MASKKLKLAAIQIRCEPGLIEHNLAHATTLVEQAARQGVQLVLLPELMPGGYLLTEELWNTAEPFDGRTMAWLKGTAYRLGIYLGTTFLEADGEHFYNNFALATPRGEIAGRIRKNPPAAMEAYLFHGDNNPHVIETELGRIGVGVCYENLLYERLWSLYETSVDLVLQPTSAAMPRPAFPFRRKDVEAFNRMLRNGVEHYARALGVPVVMANQCGPLLTPLPNGMLALRTNFSGLSAIADSDGSVKAQLGVEEGVVIAEVMLDPARKAKAPPERHGRWALPVPWYLFLWPLAQKIGERTYARNPQRAIRARARASQLV